MYILSGLITTFFFYLYVPFISMEVKRILFTSCVGLFYFRHNLCSYEYRTISSYVNFLNFLVRLNLFLTILVSLNSTGFMCAITTTTLFTHFYISVNIIFFLVSKVKRLVFHYETLFLHYYQVKIEMFFMILVNMSLFNLLYLC